LPLAVGTRLTLRAATTCICDSEGLTLVDPATLAAPAEIDRALAQFGYRLTDVTRVFYTHLHFDHYAGTEFDAHVREIMMPRAEYAFINRISPLRHDPERYAAALYDSHERIAPVFMRQFLRLADDPRYDFADARRDARLRLMEPGMPVGPAMRCVDLAGHCPGQLGLELQTRYGRTLIAADAVLSLEDWTAPDLDHLLIIWDRARLLAARRRLAHADCVVPSHGAWFRPADASPIPDTGA
jgi:glyoxylase-like metal-dependent hydrolase (beta-lactamase superfamily II)